MEEEADSGGDEDGDVEPALLRCCGEDRPKRHVPLVITAPLSSGRQHVTVHDYVSALHLWLMAQRDAILAAKDVWEDRPLPVDTKLAVNYHGPGHLMIDELDDWLMRMRGPRHIPQFYSVPPPHLRLDPPLFNPNPVQRLHVIYKVHWSERSNHRG